MLLITHDLRQRLLANGMTPDADHIPVVKLFDPSGVATWLLTELSTDDRDTLFGLCDLGMGCPELGAVSWRELQAVKGPLGLGIERDQSFVGRYALSVYAEAARHHSAITTSPSLLEAAAARLARRKDGEA